MTTTPLDLDALTLLYEERGMASVKEKLERALVNAYPALREAVRERDELQQKLQECYAHDEAVTECSNAACAEVVALKAEVARLHQLVCDARSYIDPEKHPEWERAAYKEAEDCEAHTERLTAEVAALEAKLTRATEEIGAVYAAGQGVVYEVTQALREALRQMANDVDKGGYRIMAEVSAQLRAIVGVEKARAALRPLTRERAKKD